VRNVETEHIVIARSIRTRAVRVTLGVVVSSLVVTACGSKAPKAGGSANLATAAAATPSASVAYSANATAAASANPAASGLVSAATSAAPSAIASGGVLAAGEVGTRVQVPWSQVGPGWFLVLDDSSAVPWAGDSATPAPTGGTKTLSLVSPTASRYVIASWPGAGAGSGVMNQASLAAWSGDGRRALFTTVGPVALEVDLTTGARHDIVVENVSSVGYTTPTGSNVIALQNLVREDGSIAGENLVRLSRDGKLQVQLAHFDGGSPRWLSSADGSTVYLSGFGGLRKVSNGGGVVSSLSTFAKPDVECVPVSWWDPRTIVARCSLDAGYQLWLVPLSGGAARSLTPVPGNEPVGAGYDFALRVGATTYAQHLEGCGVVTIHTLAPNGAGTHVDVPGSLSNDRLIGAAGPKIALVSATECGSPAWFGFYDPATNMTHKIVPDVAGEVGVTEVLAFTGR
jgi:hypothetical protein